MLTAAVYSVWEFSWRVVVTHRYTNMPVGPLAAKQQNAYRHRQRYTRFNKPPSSSRWPLTLPRHIVRNFSTVFPCFRTSNIMHSKCKSVQTRLEPVYHSSSFTTLYLKPDGSAMTGTGTMDSPQKHETWHPPPPTHTHPYNGNCAATKRSRTFRRYGLVN